MTAHNHDANDLMDRITRVRERLEVIEAEKSSLPGGDFARRAELLDEEHTLLSRLAELKSEAAAAGAGV